MGCSTANPVARLLVVLLSMLLLACGRVEPPEKTKELVIGIMSSPTTYQDNAGAISGFEYDALEKFAASMDLKTRYIVVKDQSALFDLLQAGKIHLAAGAQISGDTRFIFSTPLRESDQVLVASDDDPLVDDDNLELNGLEIEAIPFSPQAKTLKQLAETPPKFTVVTAAGSTDISLLERVAAGKSRLAATDQLTYLLTLNYFPDLVVVKILPGKIVSAWAFTQGFSALALAANAFIVAEKQNGSLARLNDRYFGHVQRLKADGIANFVRDVRTILPRYRKMFQSAQASSGIDWRMIAALAYQESKWDPLATSYTNVRGMMMLTEETADRLGVTDRLDAGQSIRAGARYLAMLGDELPDEVEEPDRTWLAVAAYNLGMGHLKGGRTFAKQMKRDPNSWYDMKKVLPLMSKPEFAARLKAGPARGGEAVIMVENIRNYYDILCRMEPAWQPTPKLTLSLR